MERVFGSRKNDNNNMVEFDKWSFRTLFESLHLAGLGLIEVMWSSLYVPQMLESSAGGKSQGQENCCSMERRSQNTLKIHS